MFSERNASSAVDSRFSSGSKFGAASLMLSERLYASILERLVFIVDSSPSVEFRSGLFLARNVYRRVTLALLLGLASACRSDSYRCGLTKDSLVCAFE